MGTQARPETPDEALRRANERAALEEELRLANEALAAEDNDEDEQRGGPALSLWQRFKRGAVAANAAMSKQRDPKELARSVARGLANLPDQIDNTLLDLSAAGARAVGADRAADHAQSLRAGKQEKPLVPTNRIFGRRSDDHVAAFAEDVTQFVTGFALVPGGSGVTASAIRGAVVDFAMFDPEQEQLAELLGRAPVPAVAALGDLLTPDADDNAIIARAKRAAAGVLPGIVVDGAIAGLKRIRSARRIAAGDANGATAAELAEAEETLSRIADGTFTPEGADFAARRAEDGTWRVEPVGDLDALDRTALPRYGDRGEAEATAHTLNNAAAEYRKAGQPITDAEQASAKDFLRLIATADPKDVQAAVEAKGIGTFDTSTHSTPDAVMQRIEDLARVFQGEIEQVHSAGGSVPLQRVREMATEMLGGLPLEQLGPAIVRTLDRGSAAAQAAKVIAADMVMNGLGKKIAGMWDGLSARPHDLVAHEEARQAIELYTAVARRYAAEGSKVGLTMRVRQEAGRGAASLADEAADAIPVKGPEAESAVAGLTRPEILDVVRLFRMADGKPSNAYALANSVQIIRETGVTPKAVEWFTNFLLSGPKTHVTAATMNSLTSVVEGVSRVLGGAATFNVPLAREGVDLLWGHIRHGMDNLKVANAAFRQGYSQMNPTAPRQAWGGTFGTILRLPQRSLLWIDEMTRVSNYRAYVRAKSLRFHRQRGLSANALFNQVEADLRASFDESGRALIPEAAAFAEGPTMSAALGDDTLGGKVHGFVNDTPLARFVAPFVKTSVNIFRWTFDRTPLVNQFSTRAREVLARGGEEATILRAQTALAGAVYVTGFGAVLSGQLTGRPPKDKNLRELWYQDQKPYSIKIDGEWISYRRGDPLFTPLGIIADAVTAARELSADAGEEHAEDLVYALVAGLAASFSNKSYMVGVSQFFEAWSNGDGHSMKRWLHSLGTGATVPQAVSQLNSDPYLREVETFTDAVMARVPGWSGRLPARYDVFGEPIRRYYEYQPAAVFPTVGEAGETVASTLMELGRGFAAPSRRLERGTIDLSDERWANESGVTPWERMQELIRSPGGSRLPLKERLANLVQSGRWERASEGTAMYPGGERWLIAAAIIDQYQQQALSAVMREYPDLVEEIRLQRRLRAAAVKDGESGVFRVLEKVRGQ